MKHDRLSPFLALLLVLILAAGAQATASEKVKEAVRLKAAGKLAEAIKLYEATLDGDKSACAEADGGLKGDLFAQYEKTATGGDLAAGLKLAKYYDLFGKTEPALAWYQKVAAGKDPTLAAEAKTHLASLQKEGELYKQQVAGSTGGTPTADGAPPTPPTDPATGTPVAANPDGTTPTNPDGTTPPNPDGTTPPNPDGTTPPNPDGTTPTGDAPPAENANGDAPPAAEPSNDQKKQEIEEKIKALETEQATAEDEMKSDKRKWKGADDGNYDGDMRRRYRESKSAYDDKTKQIDELKKQLEQLNSGAAPVGETPATEAPPPGDAPSETPSETPSDAPPSEEIQPSDTPPSDTPPADDNGGY